MKFFTDGIPITDTEMKCLLHVVEDPDSWLQNVLTVKALARQEALVKEWHPKLMRDPAVTSLPATSEGIAAVILARDDYTTRSQQDVANGESESAHQRSKFDGRGMGRARAKTLAKGGLELSNDDAGAILAYVQNIEEWIVGALAGQINRGRKLLIAEYMPILLADDSVSEIPGDEDELIDLITARPDYVTKASRG